MISAKIDPAAATRALDEEFASLSRRVRLATEQTGRDAVLLPLRRMTAQALSSRKLPTAWRGVVFPKDAADTLGPAFFAYTKAPKIIAAFEEGATIRPLGGKKFLWIPTENVPRGRGGASMRPRDLAARVGRFIFRPSKNGGFVALAKATKTQARAHRRGGGAGAARVHRGGELVAFYILRPQVRLARRLDVASIAARAGASYRVSYQAAANSQ